MKPTRDERERRKVRGGPARRDRLARRLEARAVGLVVVHHVHGDALECYPRAAGGEPQVDDGNRVGLGEERREPCRGVGVVHGQDRAARFARAEAAPVHRLGEPLRRVHGVSAERLEAGDEDHTGASAGHEDITSAAGASRPPP